MKLLPVDMSYYGDAYYPEFDPLIVVDTNALYQELRYELLAELSSAPAQPSGVYNGLTGMKTDDYHRSSSACTVEPRLYQKVKDRMDFVVNWQLSQMPNSRKYEQAEGMSFLRYDAKNNGKFLKHTDNAYFDSGGRFLYTSPQRVLTSVTFINEEFTGGELVFDHLRDDDNQPLVVKPKAGHMYLFPADIRYPHEVRPVTSGVRYSLVAWYGLAT